jgi:hypothetical protein
VVFWIFGRVGVGLLVGSRLGSRRLLLLYRGILSIEGIVPFAIGLFFLFTLGTLFLYKIRTEKDVIRIVGSLQHFGSSMVVVVGSPTNRNLNGEWVNFTTTAASYG